MATYTRFTVFWMCTHLYTVDFVSFIISFMITYFVCSDIMVALQWWFLDLVIKGSREISFACMHVTRTQQSDNQQGTEDLPSCWSKHCHHGLTIAVATKSFALFVQVKSLSSYSYLLHLSYTLGDYSDRRHLWLHTLLFTCCNSTFQ